jgi:hypothetical protein
MGEEVSGGSKEGVNEIGIRVGDMIDEVGMAESKTSLCRGSVCGCEIHGAYVMCNTRS